MTVERSMSAHFGSRRFRAVPEAFMGNAFPLALCAVLALHGVAHFAGAGDAFATATHSGYVRYMAGAWTVSDPALLRLLGVIWALAGVAFILVAVAAWRGFRWWSRALAGVSAASLVVVTVALWASVVGVVIDVALLSVAARAGAFARGGGGR